MMVSRIKQWAWGAVALLMGAAWVALRYLHNKAARAEDRARAAQLAEEAARAGREADRKVQAAVRRVREEARDNEASIGRSADPTYFGDPRLRDRD